MRRATVAVLIAAASAGGLAAQQAVATDARDTGARALCTASPRVPKAETLTRGSASFDGIHQRAKVRCTKAFHRWDIAEEVFVLASGKTVVQDHMISEATRGRSSTLGGWSNCRQYANVGTPEDRPVTLSYRLTVRKWRRPNRHGKLVAQKQSAPAEFAKLCPEQAR